MLKNVMLKNFIPFRFLLKILNLQKYTSQKYIQDY